MRRKLCFLIILCSVMLNGLSAQIFKTMSGDTVLWQDFTGYNNSPNTIGWVGANNSSVLDSAYAIKISGVSDGMWTHKGFGDPASGTSGSAAYNFNSGLNWKDLLATPLINLTGGTPTLDFDITCTNSLNTNPYRMNRPDTIFVIVSEDGATDTTARFTRSGIIAVIDTSRDFSSGPVHFSIDLSAFNNRSAVHIGFYAADRTPSGLFGYYVYIDNVYIRKTNPLDFAALNFQTFRSYYFYGQTYTTTAVIKNWGTTSQNNVPVILFVDNTPVDTTTISLMGGNQGIASFQWTASAEGEHMLKVQTMLAGDAVPGNDSIVRPIKVFPAGWTQVYYDDFSNGTDNWSIENLSSWLGQVWQIWDVSYPYYAFNPYGYTNILAANDSAGGDGWTYTSAAFLTPVNADSLDELVLEYDYDFATWVPPFFIDTTVVLVSTDAGSSWDTALVEDVVHRAAHKTLNLTAWAGEPCLMLKFVYMESGGNNKWWAIDNVILRGLPASTGIHDPVQTPKPIILRQNYPNPFNPSTVISYQLAVSSEVTLKIYNLLGQEVRTLVSGRQNAGVHSVTWDGRNEGGESVASGIYLYRLVAGGKVLTRKMTLVK